MTKTESNLATARAVVTAPSDPPAVEAKKKRTLGVIAGQAYERLCQLDADEREELDASPATIAAKFGERRSRLLGELEPGVRALVERMRGS